MRKFINSTYVSLDGVIENPHLWPSLKAPSDPLADEIQTELLLACDAVVMAIVDQWDLNGETRFRKTAADGEWAS